MFYAEMTTEDATFRSISSYEAEARWAIVRGWRKHVEQETLYDPYPGQNEEQILHQLKYEIAVYEIEVNDCLRDCENLHIR